MVAERGSMQHGHAALDARRDMSNAAGAYRWQTASCHCRVCHTLTCMSMTYSSFHWHARYMPLNTFPLPPAPCLLSGGKLPPPAPFGDNKQNLMKCPAYVMFYYDTWHCWYGVWIDHSITYQGFFLFPGTPALPEDTLFFGSHYFQLLR